METYPKKRIEIIIEAPLQERLIQLLDRSSVGGYTVLPALAGRGHEGTWRRAGQVTDAGRMVMVICIVDAQRAEALLESIYRLVSRQIGIVSLCDVEVVRAEHF